MFNNIKSDLQRYYKIELHNNNPSLLKKIRLIISMPGLQSLLVYRFGKWVDKANNHPFLLYRLLLRPLYLILSSITSKMYGICLSLQANISEGFYIGHFAGIKVGPSVIGKNCSIHQHVKINSDYDNTSNQNLVVNIGDNVWIGPHSVINSQVNINDGATVASGSIVQSDIGYPSLVMGNPARTIIKEYDNSTLL